MDARAPVGKGAGRGADLAGSERAEAALSGLLSDLLSQIRDTLRVDTAAVLLLDEAENTLVARAAKGLEEAVERGVRIPVGKGFAGGVAASRNPSVIDDVDHADIIDPLLREKGLKALLGVPIEVEERLIGVLHVGSETPRKFTDDDVRLLELVAGRVALPIVQSQLYELERDVRGRLEEIQRHLAFLAETSAVLGSSLDYETTLGSVARLAVPELADWCVIDVLGADGSVRRVAVVCADPAKEELAAQLRHSYPARPEQQEGTAKVVRTGRAELVPEVTDKWIDQMAPDDHQREILRSLGLRSNVLVPLVARGRTLGVLTLATAESGRVYGPAELRLAEELALRAALAVDNARLFREAEETLGLLDALFATAPVGLAFFDRELRFLKVNETLAAMHGVSAGQHIGEPPDQVIPGMAGEIGGYLRSVLESGQPILEREIVGGASEAPADRVWLASYYPVRTADGETVGVGAVVADVTERARGERRLAAQYEVTRILSTAGALEGAAPEIVRAFCENLDWEIGALWMLDGDRGCLRLLEEWHNQTIEPGTFTRLSRELEFGRGQGFPGLVWQEGKAKWVPDYAEDPAFERSGSAAEGGLKTAFGFPIFFGPRILGVAEFFSRERRTADEELIQMSAAVGSQVGQFVERKRAELESERARERLTFLAEASRILSSSLEYEETLERIAGLAVPVLADWCGVEMLDAEGTLRQVALAHVDPEKVVWAKELNERYPPDPTAPRGSYEVARTGEPLLIQEIPDEMLIQLAHDEDHLQLLRDVGVRSFIAAPLVARDRVIGVLSLVTTRESSYVYDADDLAFAMEVARRAAVAADNARLFQSTLRNEEQQRFLAEAGSALASSLDYHGTLQRVARLAVPAFADWCIVDVVEDGVIHRVAVAAAAEDSQDALEELRLRYPPSIDSPQPAARALREERPVLFYDFTPDELEATTRDEYHFELMKRLAPQSAIAVPLVARGHTVGAITFAWAKSGRRYTDADLPLAEEIARRAGLAVDNARLHRETEERARAALVLSHVGDGVFMCEQDGVIRLWNPAAEAITGLRAEDVVGQPAFEVIPGWSELSQLVPVAASPAPAVRRAETLPFEIDGRELWISITGVGYEEGTVYAFRDLTEERALEKMRSDFVSTISHELRTPLASVYGAAVTLVERERDLAPEQRARLLTVIANEAGRLALIVNDVLLASRLDSQTLSFSIESCDAWETLYAAVEAAGTHLPENIELRLVESGQDASVAADPERLRQVLGNLIDNAVKYSPGGGTVEAAVEQRGHLVRFRVSDRGIGIPPDEQERIFEKFYRLDPDLLLGVGGTGLGLYITRELVQRMRGAIWVDSELGCGSTFCVELPLAEPLVPPSAGPESLRTEARA